MTIPITQPEFGVEIEAEEKKIPANESEMTLDGGILVPETNSSGQNFRSGIDPPAATFAGAAPPVVKMSSKGSEKSIGVPRQHICCGCPRPCKCSPCHCEGPSEGSEKSVEAEREGIHPKLKKSIEAER